MGLLIITSCHYNVDDCKFHPNGCFQYNSDCNSHTEQKSMPIIEYFEPKGNKITFFRLLIKKKVFKKFKK